MSSGIGAGNRSSPSQSDGVRTPDMLRALIRELNGPGGLSFRKIALLEEFAPVPAGTLCSFAGGAPMPFKWYPRFGWSRSVEVELVSGSSLPTGLQVLGAERCCQCGAPFASNHPLRRRCFSCSPYRGRR